MAQGVDLSQIGREQVGPKERHAFENELKMMSQTRELALRTQVHLEGEKRGYEQLIAYLVYEHGTLSDDESYVVMYVPAAKMEESKEKIRGLAFEPAADMLRLQVNLAAPGDDEEVPLEEANLLIRRGESREATREAALETVEQVLDALYPEEEEPGGEAD